jgi:hypothetical protein
LVVVLFLQWRSWPPQWVPDPAAGDPPPATKAGSPARGPLDLLDSPMDKEEYTVVIERPLFLPDRRPPSEEPEDEAEEEAPVTHTDLMRMDLTAVVITTEESTAWVRDSAKKELFKLRLGDDLEGWTVSAIHEDEVELERQGETDALVLRDYKNHPPPLARPPTRARAPRGAPETEEKERAARPSAARRRDTPSRAPARQQ